MANPPKDGEKTLHVEGFPADLKKACRKVALDVDLSLKAFIIKWMKVGLDRELQELKNKEEKT